MIFLCKYVSKSMPKFKKGLRHLTSERFDIHFLDDVQIAYQIFFLLHLDEIHPNFQRYFMKLWYYSKFGFSIARTHIFFKLQMLKYVKCFTCVDSSSNLDCKNELIELKNTKILKNHHVKRISFQILSNIIYSKNDNILFVI